METGDFDMKKLAIALIIIAAVPAVATTTAHLIDVFNGQSEVVVGTMASSNDDDRLISAKSSRPRLHRPASASADQMLDGKLTANLY